MLRILLQLALLAACLVSTSCGLAKGLGETAMATADSVGRMIAP